MKIVSEFSKPNIKIKCNSNGILYTVVEESEEKIYLENTTIFKLTLNLSWNPKRVKLRKTYSKNKKMVCRLLRK